MRYTPSELLEFLSAYPGMATVPGSSPLVLRGDFSFSATHAGHMVDDMYILRIDVHGESDEVPSVRELAGRLTPNPSEHVNYDGTLCLGTPFKLRRVLGRKPTLLRFADECVVPFLYAAAARAQGMQEFPFGEMRHGEDGIRDDLEQALGLCGTQEIRVALHLLTLRKRVANKRPCPCFCGKRLGVCRTRVKLNSIRRSLSRSYFQSLRRSI